MSDISTGNEPPVSRLCEEKNPDVDKSSNSMFGQTRKRKSEYMRQWRAKKRAEEAKLNPPNHPTGRAARKKYNSAAEKQCAYRARKRAKSNSTSNDSTTSEQSGSSLVLEPSMTFMTAGASVSPGSSLILDASVTPGPSTNEVGGSSDFGRAKTSAERAQACRLRKKLEIESMKARPSTTDDNVINNQENTPIKNSGRGIKDSQPRMRQRLKRGVTPFFFGPQLHEVVAENNTIRDSSRLAMALAVKEEPELHISDCKIEVPGPVEEPQQINPEPRLVIIPEVKVEPQQINPEPRLVIIPEVKVEPQQINPDPRLEIEPEAKVEPQLDDPKPMIWVRRETQKGMQVADLDAQGEDCEDAILGL